MKRATVVIFAVVFVICTALVDSAMAAELRLRTDARPQGGVVRLGDVADILSGGESEIQSLAQIELTTAPAPGKQRILSVREIQDTLERRGVNMLAHHISGASQVTVVGYVEPAAKAAAAKTKTLAYSTVQEAKRTVTAAIVHCLQQANGSDDPWTADFELTDAQAQAVLADVHHVEASGGEAPWVGHQKFDIQVHTDKGPVAFTIEAQVGMPSAVVVTAVAVPRGAILGETDVTLQRVKTRLPNRRRISIAGGRGGTRGGAGHRAGANPRSAIYSHASAGEARERSYRCGAGAGRQTSHHRPGARGRQQGGLDQYRIAAGAQNLPGQGRGHRSGRNHDHGIDNGGRRHQCQTGTNDRAKIAAKPRAAVARTNRGDDAELNTSGNRFQ